ncbi:MAG: flagellar hook-length control protein FliK [Propionivibrio sp.]
MIPPDVASRLQTSADVALRPVAPTQELTDKLSGLVAGQKVMAEIQAMLPNGTYRAVINQRNITLALPFSAKSGDTLELQVTESDGKIALAVVSHQEGNEGKAAKEAVSATLSRTGQFISQLFAKPEESKEGAKALVLNGNQPIAKAPPNSAQDILPLLKQAITQSGMFYESHQAEWVEGRFPKNALLQEPQGKLSKPFASEAPTPSSASTISPANVSSSDTSKPTTAVSTQAPSAAEAPVAPKVGSDAGQATGSGQLIAPQTQPIVQQQLDALATQNFVWQGQVWPGQNMRWEIEEDGGKRGASGEEVEDGWQTRLSLVLPILGGVNAQIRLQGEQVILSINVNHAETRSLMQAESDSLRQQLQDAGLVLTGIGITQADAGAEDEEIAQG